MESARTSPFCWPKGALRLLPWICSLPPLSLVSSGDRIAVLQCSNTLLGPNIHHFTCDITSPEAVSNAAASVRSTLGHPTILINNAGIANESTILKSTDTSVERIFAVNTLSHFRLVREFLPSMVTANHGTVVTVASCAAVLTAPRIVDYSCTKAAALAFHEGLAGELVTQYDAPKVRTICVCPSCVQTNMTKTIEVPDKFLLPMQKVETVAEKVVQKILSDSSGVLVIPEAASWVAWPLRMMPMWCRSSFLSICCLPPFQRFLSFEII